MAEAITPGRLHPHPLTIRAAHHMADLAGRAVHVPGGAAVTGAPVPYKSTPVFDGATLPAGLRREHRIKAGVWGAVRALEGRLRYRVLDPTSEAILDPGHPGLVLPAQLHLEEPLGVMRMQVDFYDHHPG